MQESGLINIKSSLAHEEILIKIIGVIGVEYKELSSNPIIVIDIKKEESMVIYPMLNNEDNIVPAGGQVTLNSQQGQGPLNLPLN
jgi:hypothetical protein